MGEVSFAATPTERRQVGRIVARAAKIARANGGKLDRLSARMDLIATHANGCPLRLADLAQADDFNLAHDVFGIARHIDRRTGRLLGHFLPRFSRREGATP